MRLLATDSGPPRGPARARRRAGSASAAPRRSCAVPSSGSSGSTATPASSRSSSSRPSVRSPSAIRTRSASSAELAATRALQDFVATLVDDLARRPGRRAGATSRVGPSDSCATISRRRRGGPMARARAAGGREGRRGAGPPRRPRRGRGAPGARRCSGARSSWSSTPTWGAVGRFGDGLFMGHVALGLGPRSRSGVRVRAGRGSVPRPGSRRLAAPRRRTARHRGRAPSAGRAGRRRPPPPARGAGGRLGGAGAPVPPRRPPAHDRAGAVAVPRRAGGAGRARRARRHRAVARRPRRVWRPTGTPRCRRSPPAWRGRVPGHRAGAPPARRCSTTRAPVGRSPSTRSRDVDVALRARRRDRDRPQQSRVHPLRRQPRGLRRRAGHRRRPSSCRPPACRRTPTTRSTTSSSTCCGSTSPSCPRSATRCRRSTSGSLVHEALDVVPGRGAHPARRRTGARHALDRRRPRPGCATSPTRGCAVYEAQGRTGRRLFWHRDRRRILAELDRFLTEDSATRAEFGLRTGRHRAALRFRRRRARGRHPPLRRPRAAVPWRRRPRRSHRRRRTVGHRLQDRSTERRRSRRPHRRGQDAAAPGVRARGAGVVRQTRHAGGSGLLVREHPGPIPMGRTHAHTRGRRTRRPRAARHRRRHRRRCVPLPGRPPHHVDPTVPQLHRSRRARHARTATASGNGSAPRRPCAATSRSAEPDDPDDVDDATGLVP